MLKNNINLIGINGKLGSGKDTVGKIIQYLTNPFDRDLKTEFSLIEDYSPSCIWKIKKFATPIKQIASIMTGIPIEKMEAQEDKEVVLGEEWNKVMLEMAGSFSYLSIEECKKYISGTTYLYKESDIIKITLRQLLQQIGDVMLQIHPDWLLNVMFKDYISEPHPNSTTKWEGSKWIIPDLRKLNEFNRIKGLGGVCIKVIKTGQDSNDTHISETELDQIKDWDYLIEAEHGNIDSLIKQTKEMLIKFKIL